MSSAARLHPIAEYGAVVTTYCERQTFRQCWWNAVSSPTQLKLRMPKLLPTVKNWQKKSQPESAGEISLAALRTSIKPRLRSLNDAVPNVHTKKARERRKAHRNRLDQRHALAQYIGSPDLNMPILTSAQMRASEEAAFARGVQVEALMDKAGAGVARAVTKFFPKPGTCIVFAGKGHNAGDALVAAEQLRRLRWKIEVRLAFKQEDCSQLMRKKLENLRRRPPEILGATTSVSATTDLGVTLVELWTEAGDELATAQEEITADAYLGGAPPSIILDGLLGVGAKPPLREPIRAACRSINHLRTSQGIYVFAVDLPTGLDSDSGKTDRDCVVADFTVTIGFAKPGLLTDGAVNYVGRLELVALSELQSPATKPKE